ncbi:MAG: glycosyltransferase family 4 protein [Betaproteobacteria bacterium]|nr:glycosyltransferase family 4 protein [Betaproteobacteria bacterium]MBV9360593.1 glycosyltransferase family 4 protein [Betaproteobacteria bacterium]
MRTQLYSTIAMLGAAPETRGGVAAIVESYRANGLFTRWPIQYVATHCDGTAMQNTILAAKAVRDFGLLLGEKKRVVVHVHASSGAGFWREAAFMGAALVAGSPVILHLHGNGFDRSIRWFLERAAAVCVPCDASRTWVKSVTRRADVMIAPPPVAVSVAEVERPNLVLFLGHLEAQKGVYDLLEAVANVRAAVPDLRLVCAGDGDRIGVAHYAARLGIADAVKFTGWVGPSGKRALLEHAAVFALPAYDAALPVSLIEAMSAGVPVVASPVGGIAEVVADGASGFLVAPGDKGALERALRRLLIERALAKRMGAAARETARARYAPERALPVLENLYESLGVGALPDRAPRVQPVPLRKAA